MSAAVCLHDCSYDRAAFARSGIELEDLRLDPASPYLLLALDRLLAVSGAASGPVAVQSGTGGAGHVGALVLAYLVGVVGLNSESAVAWVRMVHPALLAGGDSDSDATAHDQPWGGLDMHALLVPRSRSVPPLSLAAGAGRCCSREFTGALGRTGSWEGLPASGVSPAGGAAFARAFRSESC